MKTTEVKSCRLNLCVVPKTSVVTSTPPPPIQIPYLTQYYSLALPTIVALVIKPPTTIVEDISEDTSPLG